MVRSLEDAVEDVGEECDIDGDHVFELERSEKATASGDGICEQVANRRSRILCTHPLQKSSDTRSQRLEGSTCFLEQCFTDCCTKRG
jgi:hypothetical protein